MLLIMWAATTWDDADWDGARARGWTVMGRLRDRQELRRKEAERARRRAGKWLAKQYALQGERQDVLIPTEYAELMKTRWHGEPTLVALLFAHPDSDAMRMLDARGEYFDLRTGDSWDLFFPGYFRTTEDADFEDQVGSRAIGRWYGDNWYFNARDFNIFRNEVEHLSDHRWKYSGSTDLVLINCWLAERGEPTIDWVSTISGQITDQADGTRTLTLANIIERITSDLETAAEDASYGVGEVTDGQPPPAGHFGRDFMANALGGIAAALGIRALGI